MEKMILNESDLAVHNIIKTNIGDFRYLYWTECSGVVEKLYEKYNGIKIPNNYVSNILLKTITIYDYGFHYEREIKGEMQRKEMYGFNDIDTFNKVLSEREEYINNCINSIDKLNLQINIVEGYIDNHLVPGNKITIAKLALENGIHILDTSCTMNMHTL